MIIQVISPELKRRKIALEDSPVTPDMVGILAALVASGGTSFGAAKHGIKLFLDRT